MTLKSDRVPWSVHHLEATYPNHDVVCQSSYYTLIPPTISMVFSNLPRVALRISSQSVISRNTRTIVTSCSPAHSNRGIAQTRNPQTSPSYQHAFSTSHPHQKKAGKANKAHARSDSSPPVSNPGPPTPTDEAFDLSTLESQILKAMEKLTHELALLRSGGRVDPKIIEDLKVQLGTAGKDGHGKQSIKLGDLAQVVPRGRVLNVICGEAEVCFENLWFPHLFVMGIREQNGKTKVFNLLAHQTYLIRHRILSAFSDPTRTRIFKPPDHSSSHPPTNR